MKRFAAGIVIGLGLLASEACAARAYYVPAPPPPPARMGYIGVAPGPRYVWTDGFWAWRGRWVWVPGRWVVPPRPRAMWVPGHWMERPRHGWVFVAGRWR